MGKVWAVLVGLVYTILYAEIISPATDDQCPDVVTFTGRPQTSLTSSRSTMAHTPPF